MKQLIILFILFMLSLLSLFSYKDPRGIYKRIILSLIVGFIVININVNLSSSTDKSVYVNILLFVMLLLNLLIRSRISNRNIRFIIISLNILNLFYVVQIAFLKIYDVRLFVYSLTTNVIILMIILFFSKLEEGYNESFIFSSIAVLALVNFMLGLLQYKTGKMFIYGSWDGDIYYTEGISIVKRVVGFVGASNGAGNLGAILFPVVLYKFNNKRNLINLVYLGSVVIFTILTLTRIAYVALILEFLIFFIFENNNKKGIGQKFLLICLIAVSGAVIYNLYFSDIYSILFTERGNTQSARIKQFFRVYQVFAQNPFLGVGAGQYAEFMFDNFSLKDIAVHSQILNSFVEGGLAGGLCYLFFNINLAILAVKKCSKEKLWFILAFITGNLIVSNFNPNQYYAINIFLYYFILCGIIFAGRSDNEEVISHK